MSDQSSHATSRRGLLVTFEGTEGGGKSTQIQLLGGRLRDAGFTVRILREPGGTALGEEIRHTLKHSPHGQGMVPEAELLLMNASRAQLVHEVIRPALDQGEMVLCDRFYDSTIAYQGFGRRLGVERVRPIIEFAIDGIRPAITFLLKVPIEVSEARREQRAASAPPQGDRFEEEGKAFFQRVEQGFEFLAQAEPERIQVVDATQSIAQVHETIWRMLEPRMHSASNQTQARR